MASSWRLESQVKEKRWIEREKIAKTERIRRLLLDLHEKDYHLEGNWLENNRAKA